MNQPPIVLWSKEKPSLNHRQVFGSYVQVCITFPVSVIKI